ncbi:MAG: hypothetical protein QW566_02160 [Candidatus Jordarchaeales archaeon]
MNYEGEIRNFEEIEQYGILSQHLIRYLDPEPAFVRKLVEEVKERLLSEGWKEEWEDRPWVKVLEREKYVLRIAVIHARHGEHITGADLVFEIKDNKIILIQSKRVGVNGRFTFNRLQLLKLAELEAYLNLRSQSVNPFYLLIPFGKTAFYHLIMDFPSQTQERFFHVSEIIFSLGSRKSVSQDEFVKMGITKEEFYDMFLNCKIGAPDIREGLKRSMLQLYSLLTGRMLIWLDIEKHDFYQKGAQ